MTASERLAILETKMTQLSGDLGELKDMLKQNNLETRADLLEMKMHIDSLKLQRLFGGIAIAVVAFASGSPERALAVLKSLLV